MKVVNMCTVKRLFVITFISLLVSQTYAKKKWTKRPLNDEEETTPEPNVVTYSNFGFNDVGPKYDGFVPSSPDYASFLTNHNQETSTRLYAPAFPTAMDNNGFNNYGQGQGQAQEPQQSFSSTGNENGNQPGIIYDSSNSFNYAMPMEGGSKTQNGREDNYNNHNEDLFDAPVYGTKLGAKSNKNRYISQSSSNSSIAYGNSGYSSGDDKFNYFNEMQLSQDTKPIHGESPSGSNNFFNSLTPNFQSRPNGEDEDKSSSNNAVSAVKFSKVVDFTKFKPSYPTEFKNNIYDPESVKHTNEYNGQNENSFLNSYFDSEQNQNQKNKYKDHYEDVSEKVNPVPIGTNIMEFSVNHVDNSNKNNKQIKPYPTYKMKKKPNDSEFFGNGRYPLNEDFFNEPKPVSYRPIKSNMDETSAPSDNVVDFSKYNFPGTDMSKSKKLHDYKQEGSDNYPSIQQLKYQENLVQNDNEYYNQLKNLYGNSPATSSHWGSSFKGSESSSNRGRPKQYQAQASDDEVVHIPKRQKIHIKQQRGKISEWQSNIKHGLYKGKPLNEWNKEVSNRFKSEEDLLGLRNHDTSHPQYLPNYKLSDPGEEFKNYMSENDYKNLVEKWRQSYMKSKLFKDPSIYKDSDAYGSETRPMHVPIPKPYPIEVPHPVIVPVPQPYPVRVPVPKPVAVPVIREITLPIEKPVPYPVIKKVPYPIEKPVPVPVEKEVQVPVMKPYAVPVPHVRPVFHHSRPSHDELDSERDYEHEEFEYLPHTSENSYKGKKHMKSVKGSSYRYRPRRPSSHSTYYERNRRRWPSRRPGSTYRAESSHYRRPVQLDHIYAPRHKYGSNSFRDSEFEDVAPENINHDY